MLWGSGNPIFDEINIKMRIMISSRSSEIKTDESGFQLRRVNAAINEKWLERFDAAILKSAWKGRIQKGNHFQMWKHPQLVFSDVKTHIIIRFSHSKLTTADKF